MLCGSPTKPCLLLLACLGVIGSSAAQTIPGNSTPPPAGPTLRISLTLYALDTGKVLWFATASCITQGNNAEQSGTNMIDSIFSAPDKNRIAESGCPL